MVAPTGHLYLCGGMHTQMLCAVAVCLCAFRAAACAIARIDPMLETVAQIGCRLEPRSLVHWMFSHGRSG
jgi:hypothetical protein